MKLKPIDQYAPIKHKTIPVKWRKQQPWITKGLFIQKTKLYKLKPRTSPSHIAYINYKILYNKVKRTAKTTYINKTLQMHKTNVCKLWETINNLLGKQKHKSCSVESLTINNLNTCITDLKIIAEQFADHF